MKSWDENEIVELYRAGGWWEMGWDSAQIPRLIDGSFFVIVAIDRAGKTAGMGRLISDGSSDCYIQDVVVFPEYRNKGVGTRIVQALKKYALATGHTWIGLISAPGKEEFYNRAGFSAMDKNTPMLKEE